MSAFRDEATGIEVQVWLSEIDGAPVVQIDTSPDYADVDEQLRVYVNDAFGLIWEGMDGRREESRRAPK